MEGAADLDRLGDTGADRLKGTPAAAELLPLPAEESAAPCSADEGTVIAGSGLPAGRGTPLLPPPEDFGTAATSATAAAPDSPSMPAMGNLRGSFCTGAPSASPPSLSPFGLDGV